MTMQYSFRIFILGVFCLSACVPVDHNSIQSTKQIFSGELSPFPTRTVIPPTDTNVNDTKVIPTPTPAPQKYIVKKDDFGWTIAAKFQLTLPQLQVANPDVDLNFLIEGTELVIPPPEATPVPILFTPTPVLLENDEVQCYPAGDNDMWCLTSIKNNLNTNIYYATGEFLLDSNGQISSYQVSGLLDTIPASRELPLIAYIQNRPAYPYHVRFNLQTAVEAEKPPVTALPVENLKIRIDEDKLSATVSGEILTEANQFDLISVVTAVYGQDYPAGIRKVEYQKPVTNSGRIGFSMIVYTVGPLIDRVEVFAEGK